MGRMKWLIGVGFVTVLGAWLVALYGCGRWRTD